MDRIKKLFKLFNIEIIKPVKKKMEEAPPETFHGELNRWCTTIAYPISILSVFSWPIYIPLDKALYGYAPEIEFFRWGLTITGIIALTATILPFTRKRAYWIIFFIETYLTQSTAIILGMVSGDPIYMGGFSIVVLTIALVPIRRVHALMLLLSSLVVFVVVGTSYGMRFIASGEVYGLYNILVSVAVSVVCIIVFDLIRLTSYQNSMATWNAHAELKKANELKNQLFQVAAHDLKDPLQVIIGYTDLLKTRLKSDRFVAEKLKIVHRSTDRMHKLIASLLEITSIESGKLVLHKSRVDLGKVVDTAVKNHEEDSRKKNQKLLYSTEQNCIVDGDDMMLRQVAHHLVSNAIKFSPPGKTIWVTVDRLETRNAALLKVQDEGPGLTADEIRRVFDKFQQISTQATGGEISTGLGLSITRDLVTLHEGEITVESEPGEGCSFIVTLPLMSEDSQPEEDITGESPVESDFS